MAQPLTVFAVLVEDVDSVPSSHMVPLVTPTSGDPMLLLASSGTRRACDACIYIQAKHLCTEIKFKNT